MLSADLTLLKNMERDLLESLDWLFWREGTSLSGVVVGLNSPIALQVVRHPKEYSAVK